MPRASLTAVTLLAVIVCLSAHPAHAQSLRPVQGAYLNTFGIGASIGTNEEDAKLWGITADYSRNLTASWVFNVSFGYDQEISTKEGIEKTVNSFTPALAVGYTLNSWLVVGVSAGHGVLSDDNAEQELGSVEWGSDWTVAGVVGATLYQRGPHAIDVMTSFEYGLSDEVLSVNLDLGYGFSF